MTPAGPRGRRAGVAFGSVPILGAALLWGTTGTASSFAPPGAPPAAVGAAGLLLGGLLLAATARGLRPLLTTRVRQEQGLLALGMVGVAGYPVTFYPALARTGVAMGTVVALGSAPVFAGLLAAALGRARPSGRWMVATLVAVCGCVLLVMGPVVGLDAGLVAIDLVGVALAATAGLSYAVYSVGGAHLITGGHHSRAVVGVMFAGAAVLVVPVLVLEDLAWLGTVRGMGVAGYLAVFTTFLAYLCFGHGLRRTTAAAATTLTLAEPAVAALLGVAVLGERLPALSWCGLVVLGAALAMLSAPA